MKNEVHVGLYCLQQ